MYHFHKLRLSVIGEDHLNFSNESSPRDPVDCKSVSMFSFFLGYLVNMQYYD